MADALLKIDRSGLTPDERKEIFSEAQMNLRTQREVMNASGFADDQLYRGMYHRAFNEFMGQRPSKLGNSED